jgi:DNA segregation ATPase FtsK/SpoIIIE, S-DNA-T family
MTHCAECDFSYEGLARVEVAPTIRDLVTAYRSALGAVAPDVAVRRPESTVWSAQEYVGHVRDVLLVQRERIILAQIQDRPRLAPMLRDDRVGICRYDAEALSVVLDQLKMAADLLALVLDGLEPAGWARDLYYNFPQPEIRTVEWVGRHTVHELHHHLVDVVRVLEAVG